MTGHCACLSKPGNSALKVQKVKSSKICCLKKIGLWLTGERSIIIFWEGTVNSLVQEYVGVQISTRSTKKKFFSFSSTVGILSLNISLGLS